MSEPYTKAICYSFEAGGDFWELSEDSYGWSLEEACKNGQEDCHFYTQLEYTDDEEWVPKDAESVFEFASQYDYALKAALAYINEFGIPE